MNTRFFYKTVIFDCGLINSCSFFATDYTDFQGL